MPAVQEVKHAGDEGFSWHGYQTPGPLPTADIYPAFTHSRFESREFAQAVKVSRQ
jgi:hypothetical protein